MCIYICINLHAGMYEGCDESLLERMNMGRGFRTGIYIHACI